MMEFGKITFVLAVLALYSAYWLVKIVYYTFFHNLVGFPGPWWASSSYLPQFYYDVIKGGLYFKKIEEMHEKYGPIVRINPNELHINDPFFYEKIYTGHGQKRERDRHDARMADTNAALNTTVDHDLHYRRRGYMKSFFSRASITALEPFIQEKVDAVVAKLKDAYKSGERIVALQLFGALTTDIITQYTYGECFEELEKPGFPCPLQRDVKTLVLSVHIRWFLPIITDVIELLPQSVLRRLVPSTAAFLDFDRELRGRAIEALKQQDLDGKQGKPKTLLDALTDPKVPASDKTVERLKDECQLVLFAGLDTTARTLTSIVCLMTTYPSVLARLRTELQIAVQSNGKTLTWRQLEALPYLNAFINESLRYHCFVTSRTLRIPTEPLPYKDYIIPAGTPIGAMPWLLNRHPSVFPSPDTFDPQRWLDAAARGDRLDRYLVSFTKGSRMCLGINLAYAELYLMVAALVLHFDMQLVDSSIENIVPFRDFFLAFDREYRFGVDFRVAGVVGE